MAESLIKTMGQDRLPPNRRHLAEQKRAEHVAYPLAGTTLEQILKPDYWMHVARDLKMFDHIEAIVEDGSAYYELLVVSVGRTEARVAVLNKVDLSSVPQGLLSESEYSIGWGGPHAKHRIKRGNEVIKDGFESRDLAEQWLKNHLQAQKAA